MTNSRAKAAFFSPAATRARSCETRSGVKDGFRPRRSKRLYCAITMAAVLPMLMVVTCQ